MIPATDITIAAIAGSTFGPVAVRQDATIVSVREQLRVDQDRPDTYRPLAAALACLVPLSATLPLVNQQAPMMQMPRVLVNGTPTTITWASSTAPSFLHVPSRIPFPSVWNITWVSATEALVRDNTGRFEVMPADVYNGALRLGWEFSGAIVIPGGVWDNGVEIEVIAPPTSYPFTHALEILRRSAEARQLLADADLANVEATVVRDSDKVAVYMAAIVYRFLRTALAPSDGYDPPNYGGDVDTTNSQWAAFFDALRVTVNNQPVNIAL